MAPIKVVSSTEMSIEDYKSGPQEAASAQRKAILKIKRIFLILYV
jgi:hypothetical protein